MVHEPYLTVEKTKTQKAKQLAQMEHVRILPSLVILAEKLAFSAFPGWNFVVCLTVP